MGWRWVARAVCLLPVAAGCGTVRHAATEVCLAHTQRGLEHRFRADAREAWRAVCAEYPRKGFTDEFREGFIDGYADYLDRGGDGQPLAVPPLKFAAKKKYFTPEGQCLSRDYLLGFKYGTDVAIASGKRAHLTVPVLLPDGTPCPAIPAGGFAIPGAPTVPYKPPAEPPPMPVPAPLPSPRPLSQIPSGVKFGEPPAPATLPGPPPVPAVPIALPPLGGNTKFTPPPVPADPDLLPIPAVPFPERVDIPPPPPEVPDLPIRGPSVLEDPPVVPFRFDPPEPPK